MGYYWTLWSALQNFDSPRISCGKIKSQFSTKDVVFLLPAMWQNGFELKCSWVTEMLSFSFMGQGPFFSFFFFSFWKGTKHFSKPYISRLLTSPSNFQSHIFPASWLPHLTLIFSPSLQRCKALNQYHFWEFQIYDSSRSFPKAEVRNV